MTSICSPVSSSCKGEPIDLRDPDSNVDVKLMEGVDFFPFRLVDGLARVGLLFDRVRCRLGDCIRRLLRMAGDTGN